MMIRSKDKRRFSIVVERSEPRLEHLKVWIHTRNVFIILFWVRAVCVSIPGQGGGDEFRKKCQIFLRILLLYTYTRADPTSYDSFVGKVLCYKAACAQVHVHSKASAREYSLQNKAHNWFCKQRESLNRAERAHIHIQSQQVQKKNNTLAMQARM